MPTATRFKLAFCLVSSSRKSHHSHLKSIMNWFPPCIFMLHFDLGKTKSTCCNLLGKGWGWNLGQNLSNYQATRQAENFKVKQLRLNKPVKSFLFQQLATFKYNNRFTMSTNNVIKLIETAFNGKYWAKIMLNFNIMLSKFLATLRRKS